jgi:hypothetical protein
MSRLGKRVTKYYTEYQFLTLTFDPKRFGDLSPRRLLVISLSSVVKRVRRFAIAWRIVPELTKIGMLHYHILFKLKKGQELNLSIFRGSWRQECGGSQIENARTPEGVVRYLGKDDTINGLTPDIDYNFDNYLNPTNYKETLEMLGEKLHEERIITANLKIKRQKDIRCFF